jgi:hypothetical protein
MLVNVTKSNGEQTQEINIYNEETMADNSENDPLISPAIPI